MDSNLIFWPLLTQIALIFFVFMRLGMEKSRAMKSGKMDMTKTALDNDAWPENLLKVSNSLRNQFQLPVLFYTVSGFVQSRCRHYSGALAGLGVCDQQDNPCLDPHGFKRRSGALQGIFVRHCDFDFNAHICRQRITGLNLLRLAKGS